MTHVTCRLTAKYRDQVRNLTLECVRPFYIGLRLVFETLISARDEVIRCIGMMYATASNATLLTLAPPWTAPLLTRCTNHLNPENSRGTCTRRDLHSERCYLLCRSDALFKELSDTGP